MNVTTYLPQFRDAAPPVVPSTARRIAPSDAARGPRAVRQLIRNAESAVMPLQQLYGSFDAQGKLIAGVLMVPQAGCTGLVFTAKPRGEEQIAALSAAVDRCCFEAPPERVKIAQALLTRGEEPQARALAGAGFRVLASLAYMQAAVPPSRRPPPPIPGYELRAWEPHLADLFMAALEASYQETLDCPGLQGLRDTRDVLAGHRATGMFDPRLWMLILAKGRPVGAMLLSRIPAAACVELVYLGIAPEHRGRALGTALMPHAFHLCASIGHTTLTLAVDTANTPAMSLYRRSGFYRNEMKTVMVRAMNGKASSH